MDWLDAKRMLENPSLPRKFSSPPTYKKATFASEAKVGGEMLIADRTECKAVADKPLS